MSITRSAKFVDPKAALIRSTLGLNGSSNQELLQLSALFDEVELPAGDVLMREGEPGREVFLIVNGEVGVSVGEHVIGTVGAGEFVGEMVLFERAPRSATVTALTPLRTLVAGGQSLATLLNDPVVLRR